MDATASRARQRSGRSHNRAAEGRGQHQEDAQPHPAGAENTGRKAPRGAQQQHARRATKETGRLRRSRPALQEDQEIATLLRRIQDEAPPAGVNPLIYDEARSSEDEQRAEQPEASGREDRTSESAPMETKRAFEDLPLSSRTLQGLAKGGWKVMTDIQRATLPHSLVGRDVLAAAKTGSGKTLAFVIPVLEKLYRSKWTSEDGLGALIISPTRELALQIFEVLCTAGSHHQLSAGLVIGGKSFEEEKGRIGRMNILVCTPGRLLQHLDQTPDFHAGSLQLLDRILDMGFQKTVNSILESLPRTRQTLLFSATQTRSVKHLARLSLKDPEYIAVHEQDKYVTPANLQQNYLICQLHEKLDVLFSFLKTHTKHKMLVFLSSCKQVRFVYEAFRQLQPGLPVLHLHGKQKQMKRMATYTRFCEQKHACLFATDVAARGLDFPQVDWVVQVDCPEDCATYVHRVGRTARYTSGGRALLFLVPSEEKMAEQLKLKVPIEEIKLNPQRTLSIRNKLQSILAADPALKYLAQKAFVSYMRSVFLQQDKDVFNVHALPAEEFSLSLGLLSSPRIRFTNSKKGQKNVSYQMQNSLAQADVEADNRAQVEEPEPKQRKRTQLLSAKVEKLISRKNATVLSDAWAKLRADIDEEDDDDVLVLKKPGAKPTVSDVITPLSAPVTSEQKAKAAQYAEQLREKMRVEDLKDKERVRQIRREMRWQEKRLAKEEAQAELAGSGAQLVLPAPGDYEGSFDEEDDDIDNSQSDAEDGSDSDEHQSTVADSDGEEAAQGGKRKRRVEAANTVPKKQRIHNSTATDVLEEMALKLLSKG